MAETLTDVLRKFTPPPVTVLYGTVTTKGPVRVQIGNGEVTAVSLVQVTTGDRVAVLLSHGAATVLGKVIE